MDNKIVILGLLGRVITAKQALFVLFDENSAHFTRFAFFVELGNIDLLRTILTTFVSHIGAPATTIATTSRQ
jgi:hypothetical protein